MRNCKSKFSGENVTALDLEVGGKRGVQNSEGVIDVLFVDAHRGLDAEHIAEEATSADKELMVLAELHDVGSSLFIAFLGLRVLDEIDTEHEAAAANVTDELRILLLKLYKSSFETLPHVE